MVVETMRKAPAEDPMLAAEPAWLQAPGFYRIRLGDCRVIALSDGTAPRDMPAILSKPAAARAAYAAAHQDLPVELSVNAFLIDTGTRKILVDAGAGRLLGPTTGYLVANLRAAGHGPEDIDDILLTHIHADHSGGLSVDGQPVFPNALVHVDRRDPAFWLDRAVEARNPDKRTTFEQSHLTVDPYVEAGMLRPFDGATALFPGITSLPEYGHTPGMSGYMVESRGRRLLIWGDIIHSAEVQFQDPSVTVGYDVDAGAASESRRRILAQAAREGFLVGGGHLSFPGLGHVMRAGDGYAWVPLPYSASL
jgi:glyoxylase-like metal-dependent hydrolase (beta-lactamase superfamily II)